MNDVNKSRLLDDYSTSEIRDALIRRLGVYEASNQEYGIQTIIIELHNIGGISHTEWYKYAPPIKNGMIVD